ncbi:unnamed protein product [Chironomus riparius]|uniref:Uncharacterized protein n=1 Tax=Chironomus riparius TaxID=315576 RepID=A0A9N9WVK4_9DIPT|nr:unnamed protein product [Chironomus riparius]
MKGAFIALALLAVSTHAQTDCPDCGPPVIPPNCAQPDCSIPANQQNRALFPHPDPNLYWQCTPGTVIGTWAAMARPCACGTHFNPNVSPPRCTFWFERSWQPICGWARPPYMRPCEPWCPECGGDGGPDVTAPTQFPITTTVAPPTPPACNCPCVPCIWWPCIPCNPCAC